MNVAAHGFRALACGFLAYTSFWIAAYRGVWYDGAVFDRKDSTFAFTIGVVDISGGKARVLVFFVSWLILAAFCGACWEALEMARQLRTSASAIPRDTSGNQTPSNQKSSFRRIQAVLHFNFRPLGQWSPWVTVGEVLALGVYLLLILSMIYQGVGFKMAAYYGDTEICAGDPSARCNEGTEERATASGVTMLKNVAKYMGFAATIQFSLVLLPVSRDSSIWPAIGVSLERAVVYHKASGHLAFFSLFLHGFLYMLYYVVHHGLEYAVHSAFHFKGHGVNVPAGLMAGLMAVAVWITSLAWVRRRYYRVFKTSHFLLIGLFGAAMVHYDGAAFYFLAGFTLYLVHAVFRLNNFKRWKVWNSWWSTDATGAGSSLVHLHTGAEYTRLVLRNPGELAARGGMLVYISAPSLFGTIEAHPMSVALRGAPPCLRHITGGSAGIFTLYVKATGDWTRALYKQDCEDLVIDVDGFYSSAQVVWPLQQAGYQRVVFFAGGSGVTAFLAFIQDWCEAHADGENVPEVHLVWSCRRIAEMALVGESLPSLLASAGAGAEDRFEMSLHCTGEDGDCPPSVMWPVDTIEGCIGHVRGIAPANVFHVLDKGVRTLVAGGGGLAGWILGENIAEGLLLKGVVVLLLMGLIAVSALVVYSWTTRLIHTIYLSKKPSWKRYLPLGGSSMADDLEGAIGGKLSGTKIMPFSHGRVPVNAILMAEQAHADRNGFDRVKVFVSGPSGMVDSVMTHARMVDWKMFDVEASSREL